MVQEGWTSLCWACWKGKLNVAQTLLEHGANVDVKTDVSMLEMYMMYLITKLYSVHNSIHPSHKTVWSQP